MGKQSPLMALALTLALLSLTGFPPTAGFIAKFYIFSGAVNHDLLWLVVIAAVNTVISAYYYLRVIKVMWLDKPVTEGKVYASPALELALAIPCAVILILGIVPSFAFEISKRASELIF